MSPDNVQGRWAQETAERAGLDTYGPATSKLIRWGLPILIVLLCVLTFWPVIKARFLTWDDHENFQDNHHLGPLNWEQLWWCLTTRHMGVWQPLAWILISIEHALVRFDPVLYRIVSIALHTLNALVFYFLSIRILRLTIGLGESARRDGANTPEPADAGIYVGSGFAALLFGLHPLRVEAVAWASCQPYLPAALLFMLAVRQYLKIHTDPGEKSKFAGYAIVVVYYLLAVASKAAAIMLPAVLLLLDYYPLRRLPDFSRSHQSVWGRWFGKSAARIWLEKWPLVLPAALTAVMAIIAKMDHKTIESLARYGIVPRLAQACYGICFYLFKTVVPLRLSPFYVMPKPQEFSLFDPPFLLSILAALALFTVLFARRRQWTAAWVALLSYIIILLPNIHIVKIGLQAAADRYCYISALGWWVLAGAGITWCWRRRKEKRKSFAMICPAALIVCAGFIVLLIPLTRSYISVWKDSRTLWGYTYALDPRCEIAAMNMGKLLFDEHGDRESAIRWFKKSIELNPGYLSAYHNLAKALNAVDRPEEAARYIERALQLGSDESELFGTLGDTYFKIGQYDKAIAFYQKHLALNANDQVTFNNLGLAWERKENVDNAIQAFRWAIEADPEFADGHHNLARMLIMRRDVSGAQLHYQLAIEHGSQSVNVYNNLGRILYDQGKLAEAESLLRKAIDRDPEFGLAHVNLALTLVDQRQFASARRQVQRCRELGVPLPKPLLRLLDQPAQPAP